MSESWTANDAWLLAAITRSPGAKPLATVIGIADAINHDVCAEAEFCASVGRLAAAGLIAADPDRDRYQPTADGTAIRRHWTKGMFTWLEALLPQLERLGPPPDSTWRLPAGAYQQALDAYYATPTSLKSWLLAKVRRKLSR